MAIEKRLYAAMDFAGAAFPFESKGGAVAPRLAGLACFERFVVFCAGNAPPHLARDLRNYCIADANSAYSIANRKH